MGGDVILRLIEPTFLSLLLCAWKWVGPCHALSQLSHARSRNTGRVWWGQERGTDRQWALGEAISPRAAAVIPQPPLTLLPQPCSPPAFRSRSVDHHHLSYLPQQSDLYSQPPGRLYISSAATSSRFSLQNSSFFPSDQHYPDGALVSAPFVLSEQPAAPLLHPFCTLLAKQSSPVQMLCMWFTVVWSKTNSVACVQGAPWSAFIPSCQNYHCPLRSPPSSQTRWFFILPEHTVGFSALTPARFSA